MNEFKIYSQKNWMIIRTAFKVKCTDIFKIFIQILMNIIVKLVLIKNNLLYSNYSLLTSTIILFFYMYYI